MSTPLPDAMRAPQTAALGYLLAGLCAVGPRQDRPFVDRPLVDRMIRGLSLNSRETRPGDLFLALPGMRCHGGDHVAEAL
ncbi:MAG: Mur ligase domain-containing protein, partial [Gammaproteobacteria bacterium]